MEWDANTKIIRNGRLQGKADRTGELMLGNLKCARDLALPR